MEEVWLPFLQYYWISNLGNIKSTRSYGGVAERTLKTIIDKHGYLSVSGSIKRKLGFGHIHRIVARFFLPAPTDPECQVDHINRCRTDNRAENLRWVSRSVNGMNRTIEMISRPNNISSSHHHINRDRTGWLFSIRLNGTSYSKHFPPSKLDDAISFRDEYIKQCRIPSNETAISIL